MSLGKGKAKKVIISILRFMKTEQESLHRSIAERKIKKVGLLSTAPRGGKTEKGISFT